MDAPVESATDDAEPAAEFVERFAVGLTAGGMPRMPSRVFAYLLSREDGSATSSELGEALQVSPGAISGAVRYLIQVRLAVRGARPGERRDVYRLSGDHWYEIVGHRERDLLEWARLSRDGVDAVGADTRAGRRLDETARFFDYLVTEMAKVMAAWRADSRNR